MKKLFFLMAAAAALFTSCSKDDTIGGLSRGKVTFEVSAPELATRYGEGTTATTLRYAVYDMVENTMVKTEKLTNKFNSGKASLSIDLVEGRTYEVAFWAESPNSPYAFDSENKTISYAPNVTLTANNEDYDAFFAYVGDDQNEKFEVGQTVNVTLKRPFAQLNIATNDTETAKDLDVEVVKTAVKVKAFTSFNLQTGAVEGNKTDVEFGLADQINGTLTSSSTEYDWLSMNYILTDGTNTDVTFTFTDDVNGTEEAYTRTYTAVPAKRNYRTNIIGSILTDPTVFELDIEEGFAGTEEYTVGGVSKVSTQQELLDAFATLTDNDPDNDVSEVILTGNIDLSNTSVNAENTSAQLTTRAEAKDYLTIVKDLTLDLNGCTLEGTDNSSKNYALININPGATLIIKDSKGSGKIEYTATNNREWNAYSSVISNQRGKLIVEGGTIEHLGGTDMAYGIDNLTNGKGTYAETIINGGTVKSTYRAIRQFLNGIEAQNILTVNGGTIEGTNKSIWMQDPNKNVNTGKLTVGANAKLTGDVYLFVTAGSTEWPVEVSIAAAALQGESKVMSGNVPAGYSIVLEDGNYVVKKGWYASSDDELQAALNNAPDGTTIYIAADIEGDVVATQKEGVKITIEGQNKSYKGMITVNGGSSTPTTAGLTIKNLSFDAGSTSGDANIRLGDGSSTATRYTCNVTVEGCTFNADGEVGVKSYTGGDKNLIIKNCTATSNAHSLVQAKGIDPILVEGCEVYSKNGLNFNNSLNVTVDNCTVDVKGYAVRFGDDICGNGTIKNSSLKSANDDGDAVIVLRSKANNDSSILNITNTKITGDPAITNSTTNAIVIIDGVPTVNSAAGLAAVVEKGYTNINLADGEYDVYGCGGKTLTLNGSENAVLKLNNEGEDGCDYAFGGNGTGVGNITFNGLTINTEANTGNYKGFAYMKGTFNNCKFVGSYSLNNANDFVFNSCTFNFNGYLWTWGANSVKFDSCTFNGDSRAILAHGSASTVITINNCNFAATEEGKTAAGDWTACVEIDPASTNVYTINFTGTNNKTEKYNGWTRIKDSSTGHTITGVE